MKATWRAQPRGRSETLRRGTLLALLLVVASVGCRQEPSAPEADPEGTTADLAVPTSSTNEPGAPDSSPGAAEAPEPGQPKIRFDQPDYDFGKVEAGDEVEHLFVFQNVGNELLSIGKVLTSCGCTAALASDREIPPGETGEIKVTLRTRGFQGAVRKGLTVESNDPENEVVRLTIGGNVLSEVSVEPRYLDWETLRPGDNPRARKLTVRFLKGRGLRLEGIRSESPSVVLTKNSEEENRIVYAVELADDLPTGRFTGRITIRSNSERVPEVYVPFHGRVEGNVQVVPHILSLGRVEPEKPMVRHLRVSKTGDRDFSVQKVKATSPAIVTEIHEEKEKARFRIKVTYNPAGEAAGRIAERITIRVNDGEDAFIEVPVYGMLEQRVEDPVG